MTKKNIIRPLVSYTLLVLFFVCAFLFQSIFIPSFGLQIPVYLLIPLTVTVAMFEREFTGMLFGILAGVLFDITSAAPDGIYALLFAAIGYVAGLLSARYFRNTTMVSFLMTIAATLLICVVSFSASYLTGTTGESLLVIRGFYIPAFVLTCATTPIIYFITASIEKIRK